MYTCERIYPVKLGVTLRDAKFMWLRHLFENEASEFQAAPDRLFLPGYFTLILL